MKLPESWRVVAPFSEWVVRGVRLGTARQSKVRGNVVSETALGTNATIAAGDHFIVGDANDTKAP